MGKDRLDPAVVGSKSELQSFAKSGKISEKCPYLYNSLISKILTKFLQKTLNVSKSLLIYLEMFAEILYNLRELKKHELQW